MAVVTTNVSQSSITGWIRTLLEVNPLEDHVLALRIFDVIDGIDDARPERNQLIHGLWVTNAAESTIVNTLRLERTALIHERVVTSPDLHDVCDLAEELGLELRSMLRALDSQAI